MVFFRKLVLVVIFSCALDDIGYPTCWGYNGNNLITFTPNTIFQDISAGGSHICGIKTDKSIECWGLLVKDNPRLQRIVILFR